MLLIHFEWTGGMIKNLLTWSISAPTEQLF